MIQSLKRWWNGTTEIEHFENLNDQDAGMYVYPLAYVRHHWTARVARSVAGFCRKRWEWLTATLLTLVGIWVSYLSLK